MPELAAPPMPSVAPWCNADDVTASMPGFTGGNATIVGVDLDLVTAAATLILYRLSGRQYRGVHTSFVRPKILSGGWRVLPYPYGSYSYGSGYGFGYGGWWGGGTLGAPGWDSPCPPMDEIILQGPVLSIIEVLVDGVPLIAGQDYQLYDHRRLVRSTPTVPTSNPGWPQIQDLSLPVTEPLTWCVDEATEILTAEGWKRQTDLTVGEQVYVLDPDLLVGRFEPLLAINRFPAERRQMRRLEATNFSSLSTLGHRWRVWQNGGKSPGLEWRTSQQLTPGSGIFRTAPRADVPSEPKWSDAFVELVAWYWTEGSRQKGPFVTIVQSESHNPQHVASIREALRSCFDTDWYEKPRPGEMIGFYLKGEAARSLFSVTTRNKAPLPSFLMSLTQAQLNLFISRCLDGDGHRQKTPSKGGKTPSRWWAQTDLQSVGMFEMACALAGIATNENTGIIDPGRYGQETPSTRISLLHSSIAKPVDAARVARFHANRERVRNTRPAVDEEIEFDGPVWCPTTPSGTWLARRNGTVYFTGNSIAYTWGQPPPPDGRLAAIELSCQLALGLTQNAACRLPPQVTNLTREGVTAIIAAPLNYIEKGLTGLPACDLFLMSANPKGEHRRRRVASPDQIVRHTQGPF